MSIAGCRKTGVTATDNGIAQPPPEMPPAQSNPPMSIMDEIEALAALVGESEERSESPVPAPTASIARSRPVVATPPPAPAPAPAPQPPVAPVGDLSSVVQPAPVPPSEPVVSFQPNPVPPVVEQPVVEQPVVAPAPAVHVSTELVANAVPVDATLPIDRLNPGDMLSTPAPQPQSPPPAMQPGSTATPYPSGVLSDAGRLALLDALPVSVFLIDSVATVRYANERTADMIGLRREEILGRNVLDFVDVTDLDFAADLFNVGSRYAAATMGPSRIRYVDAKGGSHWTQVWAQQAPEELGVEGFIITLTNESVRDVLATAVTSVAADDHLDHTLAAIALSARALPFAARGSVLMIEPTDGEESTRFRMIGDWPIDHQAINALGTPWRAAIEQHASADVDDVAASGLAPGARQLLVDSGVHALFVRPIVDVDGVSVGVFVVFRPDTGAASPNQNDHLDDALRLAGLAFAQKRRRLELETAAMRDALTGVANRAAFNDRMKTDRRAADALFIDLDRFKRVNDTFGHDVGDHVVAMAAGRIESAIRHGDQVYRTGGDEFVVLCEATGDDPTERIALAERIVERLHQPFVIEQHDVRIGATVGIAAAGDRSLTETVRAADRALYSAKEQGRAGWAHEGL